MLWFLDGLAVVYILLMGHNGFSKGLIEELGRLLGLVSAIFISMSQTTNIVSKVNEKIIVDEWAAVFFSFSLLFILTLLVARIFTKMFHIALLSKGNNLMNQFLGFSFGLIKGYSIIIVLIWFIALLPLHKWTMVIQENSRLAMHGNMVRNQIVSFFNWEDPISLGESYIKQLTQP